MKNRSKIVENEDLGGSGHPWGSPWAPNRGPGLKKDAKRTETVPKVNSFWVQT